MQASLATTPRTDGNAPLVWPLWPLHTILVILFFGPIISPLFRATGLPLLSDTGWLARDLLSTYICPTPQHSYILFGFPMAVCARCWGATIGLLVARWLLPFDQSRARRLTSGLYGFRALVWPLRLLLCALPFLLWPLEIMGTTQGWWNVPLWLLLLNGAQAGFTAGLFFCSVWPGLWPRRPVT